MENERVTKTELAFSLLRLFPPLFQASALDDRVFREGLGLSMNANIRLNRIGVAFDRGELYNAVRELFAGQSESRVLIATDKTTWTISKGEKTTIMIARGEERGPLPDFDCLSPEASTRLEWFEKQIAAFDLDDEAISRWRTVLSERPCDDAEVEQLRDEFRMTPRWFAEGLLANAEGQSISVPNLVPASASYYQRLVGPARDLDDLASYVDAVVAPHLARLQQKHGLNGVVLGLLLSAHSLIAQKVNFGAASEDEVLKMYQWLELHGDGVSQLGAIECGLAHLDIFSSLEPVITRMIGSFLSDGEAGKMSDLSGLIVLVEGELARTGVLRKFPPYWRRLAAIAHASLLEREMLRRGVEIKTFSDWGLENRGQPFYLQAYIDMRKEPRWLPDFLSSAQLKAEFIGRISAAAIRNETKIKSIELRTLALEKDGPLQSLINFPYPFLPGPLEGGVPSLVPMAADFEKQMSEDLRADPVTPRSFTILSNAALIFKIGPEMAELAADALRRAKYQLRDIGAQNQAFAFLYGLATVAAVTRSEALASEVRTLVRVVRRRPGMNIGLDDALRIAMTAAAAHVAINKWCTFLGEWLTELSYEDMEPAKAAMLWNHIRGLCQIEPRLWATCARADAACAGILAA